MRRKNVTTKEKEWNFRPFSNMTVHLLSSPPSLWLILIFLSSFIELWYSLWIVVFLWIYGWYSNGECHYTSNSEVRASSWSNFTKTKFSKIFPKIDFGSLFETRWGRFQLFLTEEWSSALERPCVWLSFPSLFGFWDPNLPSRRVNKNEKSPSILVFVKFDHELARTSELDV